MFLFLLIVFGVCSSLIMYALNVPLGDGGGGWGVWSPWVCEREKKGKKRNVQNDVYFYLLFLYNNIL